MTRWEAAKVAFAGYGRLPRISGRSYLPIAFIARLPYSMAPMGILILVTAATGSYADAGLAAGASAIGTAISATIIGSLADRLGQRRVLLIAGPANALGLLTVVWAVGVGITGTTLLALCFIAGVCQPQVGPFARVRWMNLMRPSSPDINVAMSYESTADELSFVFGPAIIGLFAVIAPELGLIMAALLTLVFVTWFALHPTATATRELIADGEPTSQSVASSSQIEPHTAPVSGSVDQSQDAGPAKDYRRKDRRLGPAIWAPGAGMLAMGTFFGGNQASVTASADMWGAASQAGLLYALMGFTAAIVALGLVILPERITQVQRWRVAAAGLMIVTPLLILPRTTLAIIPVLLLVGLFVGPTMVTVFSVAGERAPAGREAVVMTALSGAIVVGNALGSSISGSIAEHIAPHWSFATSSIAAVGLFLAALAAGRYQRDRAKTPQLSGTVSPEPARR